MSGESPELVSVTAWPALAVPTTWAGNDSALGLTVSVAGASPMPVRVAVCVPVSSVMEKIPERWPEAVGVKANATVQPKLGARLAAQVFATIEKSPVAAGTCRFTATPPVLEMVTFCGGVVVTPIWLDPKFIEVGRRTIAPPGMPVPVSGTVTCPPATLRKMVKVAERVPVAVGVNVTSTVQLAPTATDAPQLFDCREVAANRDLPDEHGDRAGVGEGDGLRGADGLHLLRGEGQRGGATVAVVKVAAAVISGTCQMPRP